MKKLSYFLLVILAFSCQNNSPDQHHEHHSPENEPEAPTLSHTVLSDQLELFVEFPALVVGHKSTLLTHLTLLKKHQPIQDGELTVRLINQQKTELISKVGVSESVGIFAPTLEPKSAGVYQLVFELRTPQFTDRILLDGIEVYATLQEATKNQATPSQGASINFLKEQAWKINFETKKVKESEIYQVIHSSGVWKKSFSDTKSVIATSSGLVSFLEDKLTEGSLLKKGQPLVNISSSQFSTDNLSLEITKAKAELKQIKAEYERKKQLYISKVVPRSEFEETEKKYEVAHSTLQSLSTGQGSNGKTIRSPLSGYVKSVEVENGAFAQQGQTLFKISTTQSSLLEIGINPDYASEIKNIHDVWFQPKPGVWSHLLGSKGKVLSVSQSVSAEHPLLSVFVEVDQYVEMPEGEFTPTQVLIGKPQKSIVVPTSALLEDYGNYSVIVQLSGENYQRRPVGIGRSNGEETQIIHGLSVGEVVVTQGAFQVKMASMSGEAPVHNHAH